jgi:CubicO group peptidase (beta-lactamase class C family)
MKYQLIIFALHFSLSIPAVSQQLKKEKLDSLQISLEENQKFMGSASVAKNGQIIYSRAVGFQNVKSNTKATLNTIYKVGSISKMLDWVIGQ